MIVEVLGAVGVGVDRDERPGVRRRLDVDVAEVEAVRVGVDLQCGPVLDGRFDQGVDVRVHPLAPVDQPARGMTEHVDQGVADRGDEPPGGGLGFLSQG